MARRCAGKMRHTFLQCTQVLGFTCERHFFPDPISSCQLHFHFHLHVSPCDLSGHRCTATACCWYGTCVQPPPTAVCMCSCVTLQEPCEQTPEQFSRWVFSLSTKHDLFCVNRGQMSRTVLWKMISCCSWSICGFTASFTGQLLILDFATPATRQSCCDVRSMCEWVQDKTLHLAFPGVFKYREKNQESLSPVDSCGSCLSIPEHYATFRLHKWFFWPLLPFHAPTENTASIFIS